MIQYYYCHIVSYNSILTYVMILNLHYYSIKKIFSIIRVLFHGLIINEIKTVFSTLKNLLNKFNYLYISITIISTMPVANIAAHGTLKWDRRGPAVKRKCDRDRNR